jgi:hypothetical protein
MTIEAKNNRVGWLLTLLTFGMLVYSFLVIKARGHVPEPTALSKKEKILRGL